MKLQGSSLTSLFFSLCVSHCTRLPPPATPTSPPDRVLLGDVRRHERVEIPGDEQEQVVFIRITHPAETIIASDQRRSEAQYRYDRMVYEELGRWLQLNRSRGIPNLHVFSEGVDIYPGDAEYAEKQTYIRDNIREPRVENYNAQQRLFMASMGADIVFSAYHPDAVIHPLVSPIAWSHYGARVMTLVEVRRHGEISSDFFTQLMRRESDIVETRISDELVPTLASLQGIKVIVSGSAHNYCDDFVRLDYHGRMTSVWFDVEGVRLQPPICGL